MNPDLEIAPEARAVRRWMKLSVASLILAGLLSLLLVVARAPGLSDLVTDPAFFRRCLVVHVDLSLVVWIYAMVAALSFLLPRPGHASISSRAGVFVAGLGVVLLLVSAGAPGALPVLSNYVPMIDHPVFGAGLILFALGVLLAVVDRRLWPGEAAPGHLAGTPAAAVPALRATGVALILCALTFAASWSRVPPGLPSDVLYELANWGGGHVLALTSSLAMVSAWLVMLGSLLRRDPLPRSLVSAGSALLLLPWLSAPLLAARGVQDVQARELFTELMRWAIFPAVSAFMIGLTLVLRRAVRSGELSRSALRDPRVVGFVASAALTLLGFVLGALIRGSTTMIPAHYHASIGGVTVAFMAVSYPLLDATGMNSAATPRRARFRVWQPALFALGQAVFALGFGFAGAHGTSRKVYGQEQQVDALAQSVGLAVMGIGGLIAIVSGIGFLVLSTLAWRAGARRDGWVLTAPGHGETHG